MIDHLVGNSQIGSGRDSGMVVFRCGCGLGEVGDVCEFS